MIDTRILGSLIVVGLVSAGLGVGTFAFFNDTETITANIFSAGSLDLTLNGAQGTTGVIGSPNFAPGDTVSGSVILRNMGSITTGDAQSHQVRLAFSIANAVTDAAGNANDPDDGGVSSIPLDQWLVVTSLTYDGVNLLTSVGDVDLDGRANTTNDVELRGTFSGLADPGSAGRTLAMTVQFHTAGANDLKRDSVNMAFTFTLAQA